MPIWFYLALKRSVRRRRPGVHDAYFGYGVPTALLHHPSNKRTREATADRDAGEAPFVAAVAREAPGNDFNPGRLLGSALPDTTAL
jgi:hypothetical protein